jgi:hypothetical protein
MLHGETVHSPLPQDLPCFRRITPSSLACSVVKAIVISIGMGYRDEVLVDCRSDSTQATSSISLPENHGGPIRSNWVGPYFPVCSACNPQAAGVGSLSFSGFP